MTLVSGRPGYSLAWSLGAAGPLLAAEDDLSWQDQALCAQADPEAWFPEKGGSVRGAKRICRACPVRAECLEYALENEELHGIWAALTAEELRVVERDRRGRTAQEIFAEADAGDFDRRKRNAARNREQGQRTRKGLAA